MTVAMPFFDPATDPGSNFPELLRRSGLGSVVDAVGTVDVPHATTCVALRYADGVVMAGDRRATSGNLISHRTMEKVVQADRYSGVAIAGAAGPAMEMIRLFQLQLEHYEKVEGTTLSLEGKANQLSAMVRGNLPAAMQGMVVVPIFAGYDRRRSVGRLFAYDVTGGRYEEREYVATGSGSLHASTVIKVGFSSDLDRESGDRPGVSQPLGGGRRRFRHRWPRRTPGDLSGRGDGHRRRLATRTGRCGARDTVRGDRVRRARAVRGRRPDHPRRRRRSVMTTPFYVAPEQVMKDRADYARKGIARGRALVAIRYVDGIAIVAENPSETLRKVSEIYDRIAFAGVGRYNEFDQLRVAGIRAADLKGFQYSRDDVDARTLANQYAQILGNIFTHEMKPMEVEILVAEVGLDPAGDQMFHILYDGTVMDQRDVAVLGGDAEAISERLTDGFEDGLDLVAAIKLGVLALAGDDREIPHAELEVGVLSRGNGRRCFRRLTDNEVADLLAG